MGLHKITNIIRDIREDVGVYKDKVFLVRVEKGVKENLAVLSFEPEFKTIGVYYRSKPTVYKIVDKDDRKVFKTPIIQDYKNKSYVMINNSKVYLEDFIKLK